MQKAERKLPDISGWQTLEDGSSILTLRKSLQFSEHGLLTGFDVLQSGESVTQLVYQAAIGNEVALRSLCWACEDLVKSKFVELCQRTSFKATVSYHLPDE